MEGNPGFGDDDLLDEATWVRQVLEDLLLWRRPMHSGLWLVTLSLAFFLVTVSEYTLLTLACYLILLQLGAVALALKGAPFLRTVGLVNPAFDPKNFTQHRQAFTPEELVIFSRGAALIVYEKWMLWNEAMTTRDAKKVVRVLTMGVVLIVLGLVTTFDKVLFVLMLALFSLPKLYDVYHVTVDELAQVLSEKFEQKVMPWYDKVAPIVNFVLVRLEPLIGTFDL